MRALAVRKSSGFTFMELVITVAVAAVVTSMALPSLSGLLRNTRVKQTATDMVMTLAYARNEAINRNAQVSVVAFGSWTAGWQVVAGGTPLRQTALSGEITVGGPGPTPPPTPATLVSVPTLSEWTLIALVMGLMALGVWRVGRRAR